ncbi:MAG: diguanylate cyclase [Xenococcaceae cyanobacterium MO_188.B29]|nr:diguanylate cyclase [Xenococcaceae cyanobacterium MO_188.B29]
MVLQNDNKVSLAIQTIYKPKTIKVLLIEDNPADILLVNKFFNKIKTDKFELINAEFLSEGLDYLRNSNFDVVLLDLSLPDSWGLDSLKEIQQTAAKIPIIVLTGTQDEANALAALREGAQDYLVKGSISADLLAKSVHYAIERQQNADKLRQSEARYRGVVEDQTELICRFLPNGILTFVNQVYCRYFGLSEEDLIGQNLKLAINPQDIPIFESHLASLNQKHNNINLEFRVIAVDRETHWQQWSIRAIFQGDKIIEYQAVGRDISDRKQAEIDKVRLIASLHESEERFRTMANTAPVLIWMSDANGQATFFNQSWLDFTGYTLEQALISGWLANIHPEERLKCLNNYNLARQNYIQTQTEYRMLHANGKYRWLLSTTVPRFNGGGKFAGFISSCIDISERKQAEILISQQAELDRLEAQIIQSIHESLSLEIITKTAAKEINQFLQIERVGIVKLQSSEQIQVLATAINLQKISNSNVPFELEEINPNWQTYAEQLIRGEIVAVEKEQESPLLRRRTAERGSQGGEETSPHDPLPAVTGVPQLKSTSNNFSQSATRVTFCSQLLVPIIVEKKLWGLIVAEQDCKTCSWYVQETKLLTRIAIQLGIAIQKSELYQQIEKLAVIDSLTGIANRRKFDRYLANEWRRLAREKAPLSLILCDIDYFKLYNDTYGHQAGDRCLRAIAQTISRAIKRPADLAARYGGEELAVILPNTNPEGAKKVAEKIHLEIQALQIPHGNSPLNVYLTVSMGVAGYVPGHSSSPQTLIEAADLALYRAKKLGRDRIILKQGC